MKPTKKTALLQRLEQRVEQHLLTTTAQLQNLETKRLLQQRQDGGWSIAQCLEHLNSYGRYYLPAIEKGLRQAAPATKDTFTSTWLGDYFTRMMEPGVKKYKAPKDHRPAPELDAATVVATFIGQQETLLACLRKAQEIDMDKVRIPISIARWIKLKLGDVFRFVVAHDERHIQQALRQLNNH
ncbi:DinB family protein [Taibaiella koreensis]|uniref:DinB family protein n=1 Tax=Taibaiella koreensis TaxID=1268548 RepID=UPI000E5A0180|nr:DinB family protein [Taibaiella koreensis]